MIKPLLVAVCLLLPVAAAANDYPSKTVVKTVPTGQKFKVNAYHSLNPDCSNRGYADIRIQANPSHGKLTANHGAEFPNYDATSAWARCNGKPAPATVVWYKSDNGYTGSDTFDVLTIYPSGNTQTIRFNVSVR